MKRLTRIVLVICMMSLMSCSKTVSVIPHDEMSNIFAEMLMRDQWLIANFSERNKADTTFVYGTILEDYGYTRDEFNEARSFYVDHPEILSKILEKTVSLLDGRKLVVENLIRQEEIFKTDSIALVRRKEYIDSIINSVPKPEWDYSDSLYVHEFPRYTFASVWSGKEIGRKTFVLDSLQLDSIRLERLQLDSLKLDALRLDSLRVDSLVTVISRRDSIRVDSLKRMLAGKILKADGKRLRRAEYDSLRIDSNAVRHLERLKADSLRIDSLVKEVRYDSVFMTVEDCRPVLRSVRDTMKAVVAEK